MLFVMPAYIHSDQGSAVMSHDLDIILTSSRHWLQQYFYHNPRGNDQSGRYNGIIWSFVKLALKSHKLHILQ